MKGLELDTDLMIALNDEQQIKIFNQEKYHVAIHLPSWELVSSSGLRKHVDLKKTNQLLLHMEHKVSIYINNRRVITLGNKQGFVLAKLKLAYYYLRNLIISK